MSLDLSFAPSRKIDKIQDLILNGLNKDQLTVLSEVLALKLSFEEIRQLSDLLKVGQ